MSTEPVSPATPIPISASRWRCSSSSTARSLRDLLVENVGAMLSSAQIKQAFEDTFDPNAGDALGVHCIGDVDSRRTLNYEIRTNLAGPLDENTPLAETLDTRSRAFSDCSRGLVDPVGLN